MEAVEVLGADDDDVGALVGIATEVVTDVLLEAELEKPDRTADATAFALLTMASTSAEEYVAGADAVVVPDDPVPLDDEAAVPLVLATAEGVEEDAGLLVVDELLELAKVAMAVDAETSGLTVAAVGVEEVVELELVVVGTVLPLLTEVLVVLAVVDAVPDEPLVPDEPDVEPLLLDPDVVVGVSADVMPDKIEPRLTIDSRV